MAKVTVLLVLVTMAEASIYRTITTTINGEDESQSRRCSVDSSVEEFKRCLATGKEGCCKVLLKVVRECICEIEAWAGHQRNRKGEGVALATRSSLARYVWLD
ncbi:hypothetical protein AAC387_Pa08g0149 [Persea americana]